MPFLTARTYLTADGTKAVYEGDTAAHTLLGDVGDEVSDEVAKNLGLTTTDEAPEEAEAEAEATAEAEAEADEPKGRKASR